MLAWAAMVSVVLPAAAQTPPGEFTRSKIRLYNSDSEEIDGAFPGLLLIPTTRPSYRDEKYLQPYHFACHVYTTAPSPDAAAERVYRRRFLICAANREALPFARQVARLLLLLYGERRERLRDDHPLNLPTVNVWLTERVEKGMSPDIGGEQFQNQIYLYNIHRERPDIEWAREIAHEYGHYALPGITGFKEPEEWANGVLGERLFLKWIRDDLRAGRLKPEEVAFATPALLDDFHARSIWPLVRKILRDGMNAQIITRPNGEGMDYYTGLALYMDILYGTNALVNAIHDTSPLVRNTFPRASDFLSAVKHSLAEEKAFSLSLPVMSSAGKENTIHFFLPAGSWKVEREGGALSWRVASSQKLGIASTAQLITVRKPGWYLLAYLRAQDGAVPARLNFRRREQSK